ncbi:MAG: putative baseplate assembly protein [Acidobacteriota bacterium]
MSSLSPDLFQRRFGDLVALGRARLRPLAPDWTDHNAHDPGITLMELLAWVAEAQLYSVSRMRRDERAEYAALAGIAPGGTTGAEGLIWPDHGDPGSPVDTGAHSVVIPTTAKVYMAGDDQFAFRPTQTLLWMPGRIARLASQDSFGGPTDLTAQNAKGNLPYLPFGEGTGRRRTFSMTFVSRDEAGPFGRDRQRFTGAFWPIGVIAAAPAGGTAAAAGQGAATSRSPLSAAIVTDGNRLPVPIAFDSTQGLLTTGVLLLNLDGVSIAGTEFTLELRSSAGFPRPPRLLRVEPNVIPIRQGRVVEDERAVASGQVGWSFELALPGLRYDVAAEPLTVEADEAGIRTTWRRGTIQDSGPDDRVYELDAARGTVTFGNGVNGRVPPARTQMSTTYAVSDGVRGNVGRNRKWIVAGFAGAFGTNPDPITGGRAARGWIDERREARGRTRDEHALVSQSDFVDAATALPLLEVARGWMVVPSVTAPRTGMATLVVMRSRPDDREPENAPETQRWLDAIRRHLLPRVPLAMRLEVIAPRYAEFTIRASIESALGRAPDAVKADVEKALARRLALVTMADGTAPRPAGVPLSSRDVAAWIRAVNDVRCITSLDLVDAAGQVQTAIAVRQDGLPRWKQGGSAIDVTRAAPGGGR